MGACASVERSYVNFATFTLDGLHVVSASSDGTVKYWDTTTSACLTTLKPAKMADSYADISVAPLSSHQR